MARRLAAAETTRTEARRDAIIPKGPFRDGPLILLSPEGSRQDEARGALHAPRGLGFKSRALQPTSCDLEIETESQIETTRGGCDQFHCRIRKTRTKKACVGHLEHNPGCLKLSGNIET